MFKTVTKKGIEFVPYFTAASKTWIARKINMLCSASHRIRPLGGARDGVYYIERKRIESHKNADLKAWWVVIQSGRRWYFGKRV